MITVIGATAIEMLFSSTFATFLIVETKIKNSIALSALQIEGMNTKKDLSRMSLMRKSKSGKPTLINAESTSKLLILIIRI
jgi:hypothetical protein